MTIGLAKLALRTIAVYRVPEMSFRHTKHNLGRRLMSLSLDHTPNHTKRIGRCRTATGLEKSFNVATQAQVFRLGEAKNVGRR